MPIHMGIMCEACGIVHFVATQPGIEFRERIEGMYRLTCKSPGRQFKIFRKEDMRAYRVSDEIFNRGYAHEGEYELVKQS